MSSTSIKLLGKTVNNEMGNGSCRFKVLSSRLITGDFLYFPAFAIGEHLWHILFLPDKSFCLYYGGESKDVLVSFDFGLLNKTETPSATKWTTNMHTFPMCGDFLTVRDDDLQRYLEDDYFIIICKIVILSAANMEASDFGIVSLVALTGISKSTTIEVLSLEKEEITSSSPTNSKISTKKAMASGFFQFKLTSSYLVANIDRDLGFPIFRVGEHFWLIQCCYKKSGYLSLYFSVLSETNNLKVTIEFGLGKKDEGLSLVKWKTVTHTFRNCGECLTLEKFTGGSELKRYLKYDYLRVICNVTISSITSTVISDYDVTTLTRNINTKPKNKFINIPSSYLHDHFRKLLQNNERADVTFDVNGEIFHAHRLVLAARSPIFNTELFGSMNENRTENIKIDEIKPCVFKTMLHFVYTDMLPEFVDEDMALVEMTRDLLVVADRYAIERLKLISEEMLCDMITINNVAFNLALAEKHNCPNLKIRCIEFATMPQNFTKVAVTDGYRHLLLNCPTILKELDEKLNNVSI